MKLPDDLYREIVLNMPICCVDIGPLDTAGRVLLLRRREEPARGAWWFPGGRVLRGETRLQAARRKLAEECGFSPLDAEAHPMTPRLTELGGFDVLFPATAEQPGRDGVG